MGDEKTIILTVLAGTIAMGGLVLALVLFVVAYRRKIREKEDEYKMFQLGKEMEVMNAVLNAQEEERSRIAANLHDETGGLVALLKMHLSVKQYKDQLPLEDEMDLVDKLAQNVRSISHDLAPTLLKREGLSEAVSYIFRRMPGIAVNFKSKVPKKHSIQYGPKALNVYRIVMELVKNMLKYEEVDQVNAVLSLEENNLVFRLEHNGAGMSNEEFAEKVGKSGLGLESIQARTVLLKGSIDYSKGEPSSIVLRVPAYE
jgi:two-component system, NarL family, sensor kinase